MPYFTQEQILQLAGFTALHGKILIMVCLSQVGAGAVIIVLPLISSWIQCQFKVSSVTTSLMSTLLFIGRILGIAVKGVVSDRYGRIKTQRLYLCLAIWSCLAFSLSPTLTWAILFRCLMGFGTGGLVSGFIIEYLSSEYRKVFSLVRESYYVGGTLIMVMCSLLTGVSSWRTLMVLAAVPTVLSCALAWNIPDPPRFLLVYGKAKEAAKVLYSLTRSVVDKSRAEGCEVKVIMSTENKSVEKIPFSAIICDRKYRKTTSILLLLRFANGIFQTGSGILSVTYFRQLDRTHGTVSKVHCSECTHLALHYYENQIIFSIGSVLGGVVSFFLLDRIGRRKTMVFMLALITGCFTCLAIWSDGLNIVALFFIIRLVSTGFSSSSAVYTVEVYPTFIRERSYSLLELSRSIGDIIAVTVGEVLVGWNMTLTTLLFVGLGGLCFLCSFLLEIETKGQDLEDT